MDKEKKKEMIREIHKIQEESPKRKKKKAAQIVSSIFLIITLLAGIGYLFYNLFMTKNDIDQIYQILNGFFLFLIIGCFIFTSMVQKNMAKQIMSMITSCFIMGFIFFQIGNHMQLFHLPKQETVPNFVSMTINDAMKWAEANHISVKQSYEYSDNFKPFQIMSQDISTTTLLKEINEINFIVSDGPNYNKEVNVPNMIGWSVDEVLEFINKNFLNNVTIDFSKSEEKRDTILTQSNKGIMKRGDELKLTASLGDPALLEPVSMIDLKSVSYFEALTFLKRNGIQYKIEYQFSDTVSRDEIMGQNKEVGVMVDPKTDEVIVILSKGKKIVIPDFTKMSISEATNWITENKLKVEFTEQYHEKVQNNYIIGSNYKLGDEVTEGTMIKISISKGPLKMQDFSSLTSFRAWADENGVKYSIENEFSSSVSKGNIIKFSHNAGSIITSSTTIIVYISNGSPITIPNFVGSSKSEISNKCRSLGLNCSFYYTGYSNIARDIATEQNKKAGSTVIDGTYINIGLSSGVPKSITLVIPPEVFLTQNSSTTESKLNSLLNQSQYDGITFKIVKTDNSDLNSGMYVKSCSTVNTGDTVTQGKTYTICIKR